ncbi:MAG: protein kinase, partial [Myxococcales bacterium]|nr:protein kinase [Myxococcales bacterium]
MTGKKMDRYELLNELGSSPLGSLWRARADEGEALIRLVRVRPPATRAEGDRIAEAARLAVGLEHERVASIVEVLSDVAQYGIVHEQAPGELLASVQKQTLVLRRPAPVPLVLRIVTDLAEAFGFAHEQVGELPVAAPYGGVSPDEALVGADGVTRVLDLCAAAAAHADTWARLPRRAAYQAPEHFQKRKLEPASDVFSLAAIAWELCLNRALFLTTSLVEVQKRVLAPVKRADSVRLVGADQVPRDVADVLARALRADPGERFATMADFAAALRGCKAGVASHADVAEFVQRLGSPRDTAPGAPVESPHPPALDDAGGVVAAATGARTPQPPKATAPSAPQETTPSPRPAAARSPAPAPASPGAPRERMATEELGDAELDVAGVRTPPPPPGVRPRPAGGADAKLPTRSPRPLDGRPATPAPPKAAPPAAPKPPGKKPP